MQICDFVNARKKHTDFSEPILTNHMCLTAESCYWVQNMSPISLPWKSNRHYIGVRGSSSPRRILLGLLDPRRWGHHNPSKCQELLIQWHATSQPRRLESSATALWENKISHHTSVLPGQMFRTLWSLRAGMDSLYFDLLNVYIKIMNMSVMHVTKIFSEFHKWEEIVILNVKS